MAGLLRALLRRPQPQPAAAPESWSILRSDPSAAMQLIHAQRYAEAEQLLMGQYAIRPESRETLTQLAVLCEVQQRWEEALGWWSSINLEPVRRWETGYHRARAMLQLGRTEQARAVLIDLLPGSDDNPGILTICGNLLAEFPDPARAELTGLLQEALSRIEAKGREGAQTLQVRCQIARAEGRWADAYQHIRRALMLRPQDAQLRAMLNETAAQAGQDPAAALKLDDRRDDGEEDDPNAARRGGGSDGTD